MGPQNKEIFYSIAGCPELFEGEGIATSSCGDRPFRKTGCRVQESSTKHRHKIFTMAEAKLEVIYVIPRMCHLAVLKAISLPWSWPQQAGNDPGSGAHTALSEKVHKNPWFRWENMRKSCSSGYPGVSFLNLFVTNHSPTGLLKIVDSDSPVEKWWIFGPSFRLPNLHPSRTELDVLSWESMSRMTRGRLSLPWEVQGPPGYSAKFLQIRLWNPRESGTKVSESIAGP